MGTPKRNQYRTKNNVSGDDKIPHFPLQTSWMKGHPCNHWDRFVPVPEDTVAWLMNIVEMCDVVLSIKRTLPLARAQEAPARYSRDLNQQCLLTHIPEASRNTVREWSCWTSQQRYLGHRTPFRFYTSPLCYAMCAMHCGLPAHLIPLIMCKAYRALFTWSVSPVSGQFLEQSQSQCTL